MTTAEVAHARREAPGWRDHLVHQDPDDYEGDDGLLLSSRRHKRARRVWHQVLTWHLTEHDGDSVNTLAGNMGWFHLRLTHLETKQLFRSARASPKEPIVDLPGQNNVDDDTRDWHATAEWASLGKPRGASGADLAAAVPNVVKTWTGRLLGSLSGAATIAGLVGWAMMNNTPEARLLFAVGVWFLLLLVISGALRDERDLAAAARAWPRLEFYRPARWKFEHTRMRTPEPYLALALATVVLALFAFWTAKAKGELSGVPWSTAWLVAAGLAVLTGAMFAFMRRRTDRLWADVVAELGQRRPFGERGPQAPPEPEPEPDPHAGP